METESGRDFFYRARTVAVGGLLFAAACAMAGSLLEWVTITPPSVLPTSEVDNARPFTGIEARDGWVVLGAGIVMMFAAGLLHVRRLSRYGWWSFLCSVAIGGIAFADYRGISDITSSLSQRMDIVGDADPAFGILLVAVAALIGIVSSVAGIAATPARKDA